jgi:hypothetical protein
MIPVSVPNKVLATLLDTLFTTEELSSWQIFDEKSGNVTVKLRFNIKHGGQTGIDTRGQGMASFKRQTDKQILRDINRVKDYKKPSNIGDTIRSKSIYNTHTEQPRFNTSNFSSHISEPMPIDSITSTPETDHYSLSDLHLTGPATLEPTHDPELDSPGHASPTLNHNDNRSTTSTESVVSEIQTSIPDELPPLPEQTKSLVKDNGSNHQHEWNRNAEEEILDLVTQHNMMIRKIEQSCATMNTVLKNSSHHGHNGIT